jgi:hypothetical protein
MSVAVVTGPISGSVTLADGTEIDVSGPIVYIDDVATAEAVAREIGRRYQSEGHPEDPDFVYTAPEES